MTWDRSFGVDYFASPYRLRFDLGGDIPNIEAPVRRFLQAFDRVRALADDLFTQSRETFAVLGASKPEKTAAELKALGLDLPVAAAEWRAPYTPGDDDPEASDLIWRAYPVLDAPMRDMLLWAAITAEMPIRPRAFASVRLVDREKSIMIRPYDDRGCDVHALTQGAIDWLYRKRNDWILAYDRERIAGVFG
ncbi:MAG: DUF3885 domain-containing protein [Hyphomonadaceae bacterium]